MVNIRAKFKGRRPSMSFTSKSQDGVDGKKRKKKKKPDKGLGEDSDEDVFSDFSDVSYEEHEEFDEANSSKSKPSPRKMLQKTWSVNSFNVSTHSAGVVYLDDSDDSETDDDSSCYDEFGEDNEDDEGNTTSKKKKEKKRNKGDKKKKKKKRSSKKSTQASQFKKQMRQKIQLSSMIPECEESEEETEVEDMSHRNNDEVESEDDSPTCYETPFSFKGRPPSISQLMEEDKKIDTGYSSDSALVRKRMQLLKEEQKKHSARKKKGGKKKASKKKRGSGIETSPRSGGGSLEGDNSTATTLSVESLEDAHKVAESDNETVTTKGGRKKKKKKAKKKKNKGDKAKKKRAVISFLVDGDDDACADFDKRLQEIEQFEASLVEERKAIQKERETMAFERESMEMRMDEEAQQCDQLKRRVKELEQLVHSQQITNAGNVVESIDERNELKQDLMREKREYHIQLTEKDREIEDLKLEVRDLKTMRGAVKTKDESNEMVDGGKSRERLQGELLQTVAKLTEKESQYNSQSKELDLARKEVAALKAGRETTELKNLVLSAKEENRKLQQAMENEREENAAKLKDKDETVTFLMNELARLKMAESTSKRRQSFK